MPAAAVLALVAALLVPALAPPSAAAYDTGGRKWPGAAIPYHSSSSYRTEVAAAIRAWNRSGMRIRFERVRRSRAKLRIEDRAPVGGVQRIGDSCTGFVPRGRTCEHPLSGGPRRGINVIGLAPTDPRTGRRVDTLIIRQEIAHGLAHVLGLDDENDRCSVTNPAPPDFTFGLCARNRPQWKWSCSLLHPDDARGAIRRYGGRLRLRRSRFCDIAPRPRDVRASYDAQADRLTVRWTNTSSRRLRTIDVLRAEQREGRCPKAGSEAFRSIASVPDPERRRPGSVTVDRPPFGEACIAVATLGEGLRNVARPVVVRVSIR